MGVSLRRPDFSTWRCDVTWPKFPTRRHQIDDALLQRTSSQRLPRRRRRKGNSQALDTRVKDVLQHRRAIPNRLLVTHLDLPTLTTVPLSPVPARTSWPRILMVHGTIDRSSSFKRSAKHLSEYEVISYDRRGYASSPFLDENGVPRKVSWQIHLQDLTEVVAQKPTVIFGHSYGGTLALLAAERQIDNLLGIISFESPLSWFHNWSTSTDTLTDPEEEIDPEWARQQARRFMIFQIGEKNWNRLPPATKRQRESEGITMVSEMTSMANLSPVLDPAKIAVPTIIARSEDAAERHLKGAKFLTDSIPNSELRIIRNTSHGVHLQRPEKVAELTRELIARL